MLNHGVVLIGTGVAPLVAASRFISKGIDCTILNPEADFFLENSELPFRPEYSRTTDLKQGTLESVVSLLQPDFPGAIESWSPFRSQAPGFHDPDTVHVRARTRVFLKSPKKEAQWEKIEELYLRAQEAGMPSQVLDGASAVHRFPGFSGAQSSHYRAVSISGMYDMDLIRYRNELVEYVRERLGPERILCGVSLSEWLETGIRVYHEQQMKTIKQPEGIVLFLTPRVNSWMRTALKSPLPTPSGIRLWEEWLIQSKEFLDPSVIGVWEDLIVFSDYEGAPPRDLVSRNILKVFKQSQILSWDKAASTLHLPYASSETLSDLSEFCENFLDWERFSIAGMIPRVLFEWDDLVQATKLGQNQSVVLVPGSDGPIDQVIAQSLQSIERWL